MCLDTKNTWFYPSLPTEKVRRVEKVTDREYDAEGNLVRETVTEVTEYVSTEPTSYPVTY